MVKKIFSRLKRWSWVRHLVGISKYQLFCPLFKNQERDLKSKKTSNYSGPYRDLDLLEWSWSEQEPSD